MPKVSVIIPVYNNEKYLGSCLDSVLGQDYDDFECICINDGSSDLSSNICNTYALKDSRVIVIHQENKGVSSARNRGIKVAQGNYITFVDSDDTLQPDALRVMLNVVEDFNADLVFFKAKSYYNKKEIEQRDIKNFICNRSDFQDYLPRLLSFTSFTGPIAKIFKKKYILTLYDESVSHGEDTIFNLEYIKNISSIQYYSHHVYSVNIVSNSLSRSYNIKNIITLFKLYDKYISFMKYLKFNKLNRVKVESFILSQFYSIILAILYNSPNYKTLYSDINYVLNNNLFTTLSLQSPRYIWSIVPTSWILRKKNLLFIFCYSKLRKYTRYILCKIKLYQEY